VVFLEFVIDPACSLVFEAERTDPRVMERKPRPVDEPLFTGASIALGVLLGLGVLAAVAGVLGWAHQAGRGDDAARAMAFVTLVAGSVGLIFANRSHTLTILEMATRENTALWSIVAATFAALAAVVYIPAAASLFRFAPLGAADLALSAACGLASVLWYDFYKIARRREERARP
jgi:Ca2+-transporting ATPase